MNCPNCGMPVSPEDRFCGECGTDLTKSKPVGVSGCGVEGSFVREDSGWSWFFAAATGLDFVRSVPHSPQKRSSGLTGIPQFGQFIIGPSLFTFHFS